MATAAGELEIPQVTVPWWNVESDEMESSIIPATRINIASVAGEVPSEQAVASTENLQDLLDRAPAVDQAMIDAQAEAEVIEVDASWMNYLIAAAFAVVLFSIYRLTIVPRSDEISAWFAGIKRSLSEHYDPVNNEAVAYRNLRAACRGGDENRIRNSLIVWCGHLISNRDVRSMEDILQQQEVTALHEPASALQDKLFNQQSSVRFSASELLSTVNGLRKKNKIRQRQQERDARFDLPPLYKS